jgi:hypothetical protein
MAEDIAKQEFKTLLEAQEILDQELSRRLNIDSLAVPACSLCLAYQDQEPYLLNEAGERIGGLVAGTTDSVAQMGFHCGQRGPQKRLVRDVLYTERMETFGVRAWKHAQQTAAAIQSLTTAGIDGSTSGPARLQKREAVDSMVTLEEESEGDEGGELDLTKMTLKKAKEDFKIYNASLGVVKVEMDELRQKFATL